MPVKNKEVVSSIFSFCLLFLPSAPFHPQNSHFRNSPLKIPAYCRFALIFVIQTQEMHLFWKIIVEKFGRFRKKQYLCTRFRKNGTKHRLKDGRKKEFFDKIYINRKQQYKKQVRDHLGNKRTDQFALSNEGKEKRLLDK